MAAIGGVALFQRRQNADHQMHAGAAITNCGPYIGRWIFGKASGTHGAAHGLGDGFEAFIIAVGAVRAKAFDSRIDQAWIDFF